MPITQTSGVFNTGRDCTVVIIHPVYGQVQLDNVTGFDAKQTVVKLKSRRLDGVKLNADLPDGWEGTLDVDRGTASFDTLFANIEAAWLNQGVYNNCELYQYITEVGGSQTVWAFDNVAISLPDAGKWQADQITKQRLEFAANQRRQLS
jgi:hypothetical protein